MTTTYRLVAIAELLLPILATIAVLMVRAAT